ncbi:hypothetical protein KCU89_g133, partial [Aureobasidium melanogenum]
MSRGGCQSTDAPSGACREFSCRTDRPCRSLLSPCSYHGQHAAISAAGDTKQYSECWRFITQAGCPPVLWRLDGNHLNHDLARPMRPCVVSLHPTSDNGRLYCGGGKIQSTMIVIHVIGDRICRSVGADMFETSE